MELPDLDFMEYQRAEHEAWLDVVDELRAAGVGDIEADGAHFRLHNAIVRWGEELAMMRRMDPDPDHGLTALEERRQAYEESKR
jgi:hypothetical protein